jgi:hypothetical protein
MPQKMAHKGGVMATYFIFGAVGQCPTCADHRFSGPGDAFPLPALREKKAGGALAPQ